MTMPPEEVTLRCAHGVAIADERIARRALNEYLTRKDRETAEAILNDPKARFWIKFLASLRLEQIERKCR